MQASFFYAVVYKPFQVLCQFSSEPGRPCLNDFFSVPRDVYSVGRLDADSEGLLLLTNDGALNSRLLHPSRMHAREYWVQVEGAVTEDALHRLCNGPTITVDGKNSKHVPARHPCWKHQYRFRRGIRLSASGNRYLIPGSG